MRYVYLPKLLNDLENLEQYSKAVSNTLSNILPDDSPDGLLDKFHLDNISVEQALENHYCEPTYYTTLLSLTFGDFTFEGDYIRWRLVPQRYRDERRYVETYDTVFYVYGSPETRLSVQVVFEFAVSLLWNACRQALTSLALHPSLDTLDKPLPVRQYDVALAALDKPLPVRQCDIVLAALEQLVKDYDSEEAFRDDILKTYPFALTENSFIFAAINNNLDNTKELVKKIYTVPTKRNGWGVHGVGQQFDTA